MIKIIAFAGRKQSGKTTCANFVAEQYISKMYGQKAQVYNFADALKKDICINILGLTHDQCYGSDEYKNTMTDCFWEGKNLTAREVMQFVGTDFFRKLKNSVWVDATINKITSEKKPLSIIADCRFPNEVKAIQDAGGVVIKLTRNPYNSDHESETALDIANYPMENFDLVIQNSLMTIDEQNKFLYNYLVNKGILPL
jgi:hypothetical protein